MTTVHPIQTLKFKLVKPCCGETYDLTIPTLSWEKTYISVDGRRLLRRGRKVYVQHCLESFSRRVTCRECKVVFNATFRRDKFGRCYEYPDLVLAEQQYEHLPSFTGRS